MGFAIIQATGDPLAAYTVETALSSEDIARLRAYYGLDQPIYMQYLHWLGNLDSGRLGNLLRRAPPGDRIDPATAAEYAHAGGRVVRDHPLVSIVLGIYTAVRQYSWVDHLVTGLAFIGIAIPSFWLGLILLVVFAVGTRNLGLPYFPAGGMYDLRVGPTVPQILWHLVLPAVTLATVVTANYIRYIRASMLEVLHNDYVRTARAKGLRNGRYCVAMPFSNAAIPLVTLIGLDLPRFLSGVARGRGDLRLAGVGPALLGARRANRHPRADGHHDAHGGDGGRSSTCWRTSLMRSSIRGYDTAERGQP